MAYINRETFDIMCSDGINQPPRGWFYADDRIAETIQALNLRGYATAECRIDPPYDRYSQVTLINVRDSDGGALTDDAIARAYEGSMAGVRVVHVMQTGNRRYRLTIRTCSPRSIQIAFSRNVQFKKIPEESEYRNHALAYFFPADMDGIEYLNLCQERLRALYEWACALPVGLW